MEHLESDKIDLLLAEDQIILNSQFNTLSDLYQFYGGGSYRLDLGCGYVKPTGFIGIDNFSGEATQIPNSANMPDIIMDLNLNKLPFPNDSCEEIRSSHFLEHSQVMHIISESHRVLRPGGLFMFAIPYANSAEGMYPGHYQFLTEKWFYENISFNEKFRIEREEYFPSKYWLELPKIIRLLFPFNFARKFFFNACCQMILWCSAKK
jgi:SAM-dependent methyltransferase